MRAYYFGCYGPAGHVWHGQGMRSLGLSGAEGTPWLAGDVDGGLAPRDGRDELPQGVAALHHRDGWTALSFWDRTGDSRGNSNSTFVLEAELDFDQALALARELFPELFARFDFEVVQA